MIFLLSEKIFPGDTGSSPKIEGQAWSMVGGGGNGPGNGGGGGEANLLSLAAAQDPAGGVHHQQRAAQLGEHPAQWGAMDQGGHFCKA